MSPQLSPAQQDRMLHWALLGVFALFAILAVRYQIRLLEFREWGDESETVVTVKMIMAGEPLYDVIFNHHGPLTFLPGLLVEAFGNFSIPGHRVPIMAMQWFALAAIYFSPLATDRSAAKIHVVLAASVMLLYLPPFFGHMYKYQVMAGLMLIMILAQYTLPAIVNRSPLHSLQVVGGSALLASLPFLAVTYTPVALLLFVASLRRETLRAALIGGVLGLIFNVAFLAVIGSIPGFLAYHLYMNLRILPEYTGHVGTAQLIYTAFGSAMADLSQFLLLSLVVLSIARLGVREGHLPWRSVLVALGIGSLLIRGVNFHALPYFYAVLALPLAFYRRQSAHCFSSMVLIALVVICAAKISLLFPADRDYLRAQRLPPSTDFSRLVQHLTDPEERILAYSFQNYQYLAADRLPASGHFFYLPWQARYNEAPRFGVQTDPCADIRQHRPKVLLIDEWTVWDRYPWESYAGCLLELVDEHYQQLTPYPFYLRSDTSVTGLDTEDTPSLLHPSPPLKPEDPIALHLSEQPLEPLVRLGIRFGTYMRRPEGTAELHLSGPEDSARIPIVLRELGDNLYHFVEVPPGRYTLAALHLVEGADDLSTWEVHFEDGATLTCLQYRYESGAIRFTPGCPLF